MLNPDFSDRTYTAEVLRVSEKDDAVMQTLTALTTQPRTEAILVEETEPSGVRVIHAFLPARREYHRTERAITLDNGRRLRVPRRVARGNGQTFLYDILIVRSRHHIVIAVPFHGLAEQFFVQADDALAGKGAKYTKVNIKRLVMQLGSKGATNLSSTQKDKRSLSVTRCHLAYTDLNTRNRDLQQIQMTGADLGATEQYRDLVGPVLFPERTPGLKVTPVILGFALLLDGVKKSSAVTDMHGNFKVWVSPGLRRVTRLFSLLRAIEEMEKVASTTGNVPILQSATIRATGE